MSETEGPLRVIDSFRDSGQDYKRLGDQTIKDHAAGKTSRIERAQGPSLLRRIREVRQQFFAPFTPLGSQSNKPK